MEINIKLLLIKSEYDTQTVEVANNDGDRVVTQRDRMVQSTPPVSVKCFLMLPNAKSFTWIAGTRNSFDPVNSYSQQP